MKIERRKQNGTRDEKRIQVVSFHLQMECNRKFYDETCIHTKLAPRIVCIAQITIRFIFPPSIAVIVTCLDEENVRRTGKKWNSHDIFAIH